MWVQRAKKVVSDNLGLVDFAIEPVNAVLNMFNGQVKVFVEFKLHTCKNCEINQKFWGLLEMNFGLVLASYSLPKW